LTNLREGSSVYLVRLYLSISAGNWLLLGRILSRLGAGREPPAHELIPANSAADQSTQSGRREEHQQQEEDSEAYVRFSAEGDRTEVQPGRLLGQIGQPDHDQASQDRPPDVAQTACHRTDQE
jgi:hypothetical protein